ncbi:hypothetical protein IQ227_01495 [Anabaena aphanizomenioides LEGE 00250]|uniref:Uncharacterized protein n=1 Tax=Sphaerospermopsis aphanizomenoides LEGE 00250 TaxID=2777972 RepID=A0ABR9V8C8_9CYAN|nr:hypothetical protein [Sphaerospermopsis aphanizomenoides]MBE9234743.1 hypothetical protein [Sphaerospermopsis aphanizomenoides LEGE 00250]
MNINYTVPSHQSPVPSHQSPVPSPQSPVTYSLFPHKKCQQQNLTLPYLALDNYKIGSSKKPPLNLN